MKFSVWLCSVLCLCFFIVVKGLLSSEMWFDVGLFSLFSICSNVFLFELEVLMMVIFLFMLMWMFMFLSMLMFRLFWWNDLDSFLVCIIMFCGVVVGVFMEVMMVLFIV